MTTLYFDDIFIAGNFLTSVHTIKVKISRMFEMEDCGEAKHCLGFGISCDGKQNRLETSIAAYAHQVLVRFGMNDEKPVSTPIQCQLGENDFDNNNIDSTLYSCAVRSLIYLMVCIRPDISFV